MTPALADAALAISLPIAAVAWLAGALLDRAEAAPAQRHLFWSVGFWASPIAAIAVMVLPAPLRPSLAAPPPMANLPDLAPPSVHGAYGEILALGLLIVVLAGAAFRLGLLAVRLGALHRIRARASRSLPRASRSAIRRATQAWPRLPIRLSEAVAHPILVGLRRPVIILPARFGAAAAAEAAALVCRHEAEHAARHDNLRLLLEELAAAIFWFNPALHAVRTRLSAAREERCDAVVVAGLGPQARQLYARTLIEQLHLRSSPQPTAGLIGLTRKNAAMRITSILRPAPARPRRALLAATVAIVSASACLAAGLAAAQQPAAVEPAAQASPPDGAVDVRADALKQGDGVMVWTGNVTATGRLGAAGKEITVDGRRVEGGLDLAAFGPGRIAALKVTQPKQAGDRMRVDIVTDR